MVDIVEGYDKVLCRQIREKKGRVLTYLV